MSLRDAHNRVWKAWNKGMAWKRASNSTRETVDEYLARGGTITICPAMIVQGPCIPQLSMSGRGGTRRPAMV